MRPQGIERRAALELLAQALGDALRRDLLDVESLRRRPSNRSTHILTMTGGLRVTLSA
jgi:hypothetical protein